MAQINANSDVVKVFPSAYRKNVTIQGVQTTFNPEASLNTEFNLTSFSNRLTDYVNNSFVVKKDDNEIIFCIRGYWFDLTDISSVRTADKPLWACIKMLRDTYEAATGFNNPILTGFDSSSILDNLDNPNGKFLGVMFDDSNTGPTVDNVSTFKLQILDASGNVPANSWLVMSTKQIKDHDNQVPITQKFKTNEIEATTSVTTHNVYAKNDGDGYIETDDIDSGSMSVKDITIKEAGVISLQKATGDTGSTNTRKISFDKYSNNDCYIDGAANAKLGNLDVFGTPKLSGVSGIPGASQTNQINALGIKSDGTVVATAFATPTETKNTTSTLRFVTGIAEDSKGQVSYTSEVVQEAAGNTATSGSSNAKAGIVSTGTQSFAGGKTFQGKVAITNSGNSDTAADNALNVSGGGYFGGDIKLASQKKLKGIATHADKIMLTKGSSSLYYSLSFDASTGTLTISSNG